MFYDTVNIMKKDFTLLALNRLAEQIGYFIEYWGFKKIHGQMWTHIYLSSSPISAVELSQKLGVSKALISLSIRDLEAYNLIHQIETDNKKTKLFVANAEIFKVITNVLRSRELLMLKQIQADFEILKNQSHPGDSQNLDSSRVDELGNMVTTASDLLENLIAFEAIDPSVFSDI